jgi:hypothetical protein
MADDLPSAIPAETGGDKQATSNKPGGGGESLPAERLAPGNTGKRKRSRFPPSKRVDFAAGLGLVVWVWSEMMATHEPSKLCVQWLIIVIFYIPVCYYISRWRSSASLGWVLFSILSVITAVFAYSNTFSPAFSIIPRVRYAETKTPRHFLLWNINGREILSPINVIMAAQFTNLRDKAMTVNSYQFEGRTTNNTWETMPTMDIKMGRVVSFVGTNWGPNGFGIFLGPAKEGDVYTSSFGDNVFPEVLNERIIAPGGTVPGVFFLEAPQHGFDGAMRCRIRDSTDKEFVEMVSPLRGTNFLQTTLRWGSGESLGIPEQKDIKALPIVPWSREWH